MLAWLLILACKGADPTPPGAPPEPSTGPTGDTAATPTGACLGAPTWETFASGYIQTWCTPCHTANLVGEEARQGAPEGIDFDRWSQVVAWESRILARATGPSPDMPPLGGTDPDDVARLEAWFACGAPGEDAPPGPCDTLVWAEATQLSTPVEVEALCASANAVRGLTVAGDLTVDCLCEVDGDLRLEGVTALPRLTAVRGDLTLAGPSASLPALREVSGQLTTLSPVAGLILPALEHVGGDLLASGPALATVDLPSLTEVGGALTLRDAPATQIDLSRLRTTGGALVLEDLPLLEALVGLGAVEDVGGELRLESIGTLAALDHFRLLERVGGDVVLRDLATVVTLDGFTVLPSAQVRVEAMPALLALEGFDNLVDAPALTITDNPKLLNVFGFVNLLDAGDVVIARNGSLRSLGGLAALRSARSLQLDALPVPDLPWFTQLSEVDGDLRLTRLPTLARATGLAALARVGGTLEVRDAPALRSLDGALAEVGAAQLLDLPSLESVGMLAGLTSIAGDLSVEATGLTGLSDLDALQTVGGDLRLVDNPRLPTLEAQAFADRVGVGGVSIVEGNAP